MFTIPSRLVCSTDTRVRDANGSMLLTTPPLGGQRQSASVIFICGHVRMHVAHWIGAPDGDVVGGTGRRASTGTPPCGNYANRGFSP